jgi:hypothetical protein
MVEEKGFPDEEGIKLVNELSKINEQLTELKNKQASLKENLVKFAKEKGMEFVSGTDMKATIKEFEKLILPEDRKKFVQMIKDKGLYEEYSNLSYARLNSKFLRGELEDEIKDTVKTEKDWRISLSKKRYD